MNKSEKLIDVCESLSPINEGKGPECYKDMSETEAEKKMKEDGMSDDEIEEMKGKISEMFGKDKEDEEEKED